MPIFKQFIKSLYSPKHIAQFRMNGIGKTMNYLFLLSLLMSTPLIVHMIFFMLNGDSTSQNIIETTLPILTMQNEFMEANSFIVLPVALIVYYFFVSFIVFVKVSIYGGIGLLIAHLKKKRGEYRHLFRMAAYAVTLPTLFITVIELTGFTMPFGFLFDWLLTSVILFMSVRCLPSTQK